MRPAVSVIIPVLNDAAALQRCLSALSGCSTVAYEVIVCDGGGDAACAESARRVSAQYLSTTPGRAVQMNAGAARAAGEWLWFLHADCTPAAGSIEAIAGVDERRAWGCFRHRLDAAGLALRAIEAADNVRARLFALPYGDQGIFVRREVFEMLGGYAPVPLLEDVLLAQALARIGNPRVLSPVLRTDARRWLRRGVLATTLINWRVLYMYFIAGRPLESIAALYRGAPEPGNGSVRSSESVSGAI
jgi:rSAM/selenodomain-associated transferase 2